MFRCDRWRQFASSGNRPATTSSTTTAAAAADSFPYCPANRFNSQPSRKAPVCSNVSKNNTTGPGYPAPQLKRRLRVTLNLLPPPKKRAVPGLELRHRISAELLSHRGHRLWYP